MDRQGVLPSQDIRDLIANNYVGSDIPIKEDQIQPGSLEPSLSKTMHRIVARPTSDDLREETLLERDSKYRFDFVEKGNPIEFNVWYMNKVREQFNLPEGVTGYANNKSSSGRINLEVKLTTAAGDEIIPSKFKYPIYHRINARLSLVHLRIEDRLNQIRFIYGNAELDDLEIKMRAAQSSFLYDKKGDPVPLNKENIQDGIITHLNLEQEIVGYKAKRHPSKTLDLSCRDHNWQDFWDEVRVDEYGRLLLEEGEFYILGTDERISIPPEYCMEMIPYSLSEGEFRSHKAGFFDPGFGWKKDKSLLGTPATLEIIPRENIFVRHGQKICKFKVLRMRSVPDKIYGPAINSNYQDQNVVQLAKYFSKPLLKAA